MQLACRIVVLWLHQRPLCLAMCGHRKPSCLHLVFSGVLRFFFSTGSRAVTRGAASPGPGRAILKPTDASRLLVAVGVSTHAPAWGSQELASPHLRGHGGAELSQHASLWLRQRIERKSCHAGLMGCKRFKAIM